MAPKDLVQLEVSKKTRAFATPFGAPEHVTQKPQNSTLCATGRYQFRQSLAESAKEFMMELASSIARRAHHQVGLS